MKKRGLTIILAAMLAVSSAGCGAGGNASQADEAVIVDTAASGEEDAETESAEGEESAQSVSESAPEEDATESSAGETESTKEEDKQEEQEEVPPLELGAVEGGEYKNPYFDMKTKLESPWTFYDADQLKKMNAQLEGVTTAAEVQEALDSGSTYIDMAAINGETGESLNVSLTYMSALTEIEDMGSYIDEAMPDLEKELSAEGLQNLKLTREQGKFLGKEQPLLLISSENPYDESSTYMVYERQAYVVSGRYLACVTATSLVVDSTEEALAAFFTIDTPYPEKTDPEAEPGADSAEDWDDGAAEGEEYYEEYEEEPVEYETEGDYVPEEETGEEVPLD